MDEYVFKQESVSSSEEGNTSEHEEDVSEFGKVSEQTR